MALNTIPLPYGLRQVRLTPYTDAAATILGTAVTLPYSRTLTFTEAEDFNDLRGDDQLITSHGSGPHVEWELEGGGISLEAAVVMYGGGIVTTGVTPNQIKTLTKNVTDLRPFFKIEGRSISDSGGDFHTIIYKAKSTDNLSGSFNDGDFFLTGAKGLGYGSTESSSLGKLWAFVQNETAVVIP